MAADSRSLVVVVDTNRPEQVQAQELLESCNRVAVIDHHRRAATYIEGAALNYHEPYASSACELVTELLQYIAEPTDLLRTEAEALLAGIVLDTKNFTMRTGGRTFEAAAFLRRSGADTGEVKRLFQNDLSGTIAKYDIIQNAQLYRDDIAIAVVDHTVGRVTAAQAADELLNIVGIDTSFVLFPDGEQIIISGPLHGRHQRPGHPGAAGGRRQRRRRRRPGGGQDAGTGGRGADTGHRPAIWRRTPEGAAHSQIRYFLKLLLIVFGGTQHESDFTAGREGPGQEGPAGGGLRRLRPQLPSAPEAGGALPRRRTSTP